MAHREYEIRLASRTESQLYDHFKFLARVSGPAAEKLLDILYRDIESLAVHPHRNPRYTRPYAPPGEYRWMLSYERYRIIYEIFEEPKLVYIVDVEDCRQNSEGLTP